MDDKKYFTRMLPRTVVVMDVDNIEVPIYTGEPVMCLCTSKIPIGGYCMESLPDGRWMDWKVDNENDLDPYNQLVVIAEVDKHQEWVAEGTQLSDDDVKLMALVEYPGGIRQMPISRTPVGKKYKTVAIIRCPHCNRF